VDPLSDDGDCAASSVPEASGAQGCGEPAEGDAGVAPARPLLIAVTQSVLTENGPDGRTTRRDALEQSWAGLLEACGFLAVPVPNRSNLAARFLDEAPIDGLLLTCGNELAVNGGDAPERDRAEYMLVTHAIHRKLPVLGVGRGMQIIQRMFSAPTSPAQDHISPAPGIALNGGPETAGLDPPVAAALTAPELEVWARGVDGAAAAIRIDRYRITGIMWRPETRAPFCRNDIDLIRRAFGACDGAGAAAQAMAESSL
jgi:putative glutamine amidotransferase